MSNIKSREIVKGTIKKLDKGVIATQKTKDTITKFKEKSEDTAQSKENDASEYAINRITDSAKYIYNNSGKIKQKGNQSVKTTKDNLMKAKVKIKDIRNKQIKKKKIKDISDKMNVKSIKLKNDVLNQKKAFSLVKNNNVSKMGRKLQISKFKNKLSTLKKTGKAFVNSAKAIILGTKALITALIAGGWIIVVIVIVICLIGLLCSSIFGIFLSGAETSENALTISDVISECNLEFTNRLEAIQSQNPHDDYVLEGSMASWKDIIIIYAVVQTGGINEKEVITVDEVKKMSFKQIFWDMNILSSEVREEQVIEQGVNSLETPKEVRKRVLHITITSKTLDDMILQYNLNPTQVSQLRELDSSEYDSLWNGVIYGLGYSDNYSSWKQTDIEWANVKIGNTNSTIKDIGCLVTSIAILIDKSGIETGINPFNPGTFVEALNKENGFDSNGNLQYNAINKIIPSFKYGGQDNLKNKTKEDKLQLITQYFNSGYFLTVEVKGATPGNQHWVAVTGINGSDVLMTDPGSNHNNMWNAYEVSKTSKFNYFIVS